MEPQRISGRCNCGAVAFVATGLFRQARACHCRTCRRQSGHYLAATRVDSDCLRVTGEQKLTWFEATPSARRGFCRICGSHLFWEIPGSGFRSILMGSIDNAEGLELSDHIFVSEKGVYYKIGDDLPQHDLNPPDPSATSF